MPNIASLFLLQRLKESMSGDACDFNNMETRAVIECFTLPPPERQGAGANSRHSDTQTLGKHAPLYATFKNWVTQFKSGDSSTCDEPRPGRLKTVTTPVIIDQFHELNLEDRPDFG